MSILIKNISHNNQICDIFIENSRFARIAPQLDQLERLLSAIVS